MARRTKIKAGNPRKSSRFICLNCLQSDLVTGEGIQRRHGQRNENHIKDLWCCRCRDTVKTLEVRYFDDYEEKMEEAKELRNKYYEMEDSNCFWYNGIRISRWGSRNENNERSKYMWRSCASRFW